VYPLEAIPCLEPTLFHDRIAKAIRLLAHPSLYVRKCEFLFNGPSARRVALSGLIISLWSSSRSFIVRSLIQFIQKLSWP
jgi:hypothetical protein